MKKTMKINVIERENISIISPQGEIDLYNANELQDIFMKLIVKGKYDIVVNLSQVPFIDSSGIVALITYQKKLLQYNGNLRLTNVLGFVSKLFDQYSIKGQLEIYESEQEAINAFNN